MFDLFQAFSSIFQWHTLERIKESLPKEPRRREKLAIKPACKNLEELGLKSEAAVDVSAVCPHDSDAAEKCLADFSSAYVIEDLPVEVEAHNAGPGIVGNVTLDFVLKMMDDFKNQIFLEKRYARELVLRMTQLVRDLPSLVDIHIADEKYVTICGDVHGQFFDLVNIFELNGFPSNENQYVFNGNLVDMGSCSVEVVLTLFAFKCMDPSAVHIARGSHETRSMNRTYGFEGEVMSKLDESFVVLFAEVFCQLPLVHVLNKRIFVVHGGLFSNDDVRLSNIAEIDRDCEPTEGLMCEMLWSDPMMQPGRQTGTFGRGVRFGPDVTDIFLKRNNLDLIVRSHEVKKDGYEMEHGNRLITVFSTPNFCDQRGNKGAFIRFRAPNLQQEIVTFSAVPHPDVPVSYANLF